MNLKQLEAFVEVAQSGSFSKAARKLFLTQPTISAHIAALEKELDVRLFVRNTKEVALSPDGQKLYTYARQILDLTDRIRMEFGRHAQEEKTCITIAAVHHPLPVPPAGDPGPVQREVPGRTAADPGVRQRPGGGAGGGGGR